MQLLAVAMPKEVLEEYEAVVLAAGYLPGAVLPSTLAALAGLEETPTAVLVVNAGVGTVTTAIVQGGMLLLHRSVDMSAGPVEAGSILPLVSREIRRRSGRSRRRWGRVDGTDLNGRLRCRPR